MTTSGVININTRHLTVPFYMCKYKECKNKIWANGYCKPHLNHLRRYGEARRLRTAGNVLSIIGDRVSIEIYDAHRRPVLSGLIDLEDIDKVKNIYWGFNGNYIKEGTSKHVRYLHHVIIGKPPKGKVVDHINRNKLDNRKSNLRFVTFSENNSNK